MQTTHISKFARQLHGFMPPCVLPTGHAGDCQDGFGGHYTHPTEDDERHARAVDAEEPAHAMQSLLCNPAL